MRFREVQIEDDKSIASSGTETIDLDLTDPITMLLVRFKAKNSTSVLNDEPPENQVTKIEIVDGGKTYWSLPGPEAVAAACFDSGKYPDHWYDESASNNQRMSFGLYFGRFVGDRQFAFDPTPLTNPQLKFTWALQAGYTTTDLTLGITARIMEDVAPPSAMLCWKEVESFTTGGSGVKRVEMPIDFNYRRLLIRNYAAQGAIYNGLSHFKLDCDIGGFVPFDLDQPEWDDICKQAFGPFSLMKLDRADYGGAAQAWMDGDMTAFCGSETAGSIVSTYTSGWNYYQQRCLTDAGVGLTDQKQHVLVHGYYPHSSYCYQFGLKDEPDTWFRAPEFGRIDLKLTQNVISIAASVAVQQPRTLP